MVGSTLWILRTRSLNLLIDLDTHAAPVDQNTFGECITLLFTTRVTAGFVLTDPQDLPDIDADCETEVHIAKWYTKLCFLLLQCATSIPFDRRRSLIRSINTQRFGCSQWHAVGRINLL